ncbi:MAG: septal ring lytic transglycosylase RlpA family protein [Candidatus Rariloculaceae bacterium]
MRSSVADSVTSPALAVAIFVLFLSGCSSQPVQTTTADDAQREAIVNPERSERGNPPVYEVFGERYYVMETSAGYRERGVASWYGDKFHGRPTSSGEPYDMYQMTAAHKSLPLPTWVEVTHAGNGRQIIVKVNDRGPFVDDRIIDLSYAAAEQLGMTRAGTAMVEVRALGAPAPTPTNVFARENPQSESADSGGFSIISTAGAATPNIDPSPLRRVYAQVGAYSQHDNALRMVGRLEAGGYDEVTVVSERSSTGEMHRVRIGPLADLDAYDRVVEGLVSLGVTESRLVVEQ